MPLSTVSAVLKRNGVGKLGRIGLDPAVRYERTHAFACRKLGIRHLRTRPYRPQTNGKAERFIPTLLAGWAYGAIYQTSHEPASP